MPDIVLRDRSGNPLNFYGAEYLDAVTPDGTEIPYAAYDPETLIPENIAEGVKVGDVTGEMVVPDVLENLPIALDFSNGDQTISAPDGQAVKSAIIQKPENLTPANIAEGVDIAGIVGTMTSGSGFAIEHKYSRVSLTGTWNERVSIDFGFKPDFLLVYPTDRLTISDSYFMFFGFSQKYKDMVGSVVMGYAYVYSGAFRLSISSTVIDSTDPDLALNSATETGFTFGKSHKSGSYYVLALNLLDD